MRPVLVDTCVWVRHFRSRNPYLIALLEDGEILCHPTIVGELSMGALAKREQTILDLATLDRPPIASESEVHQMVESRKLWDCGIQWNDASILASVVLGNAQLWTFDLRLNEIASKMGFAYSGG